MLKALSVELIATKDALRDAIADARSNADERYAPEGLRDQLGGAERRIVELTQERDTMRNERNTHTLLRQQVERERDEAWERIATLEAALEKAADTFRDIGRMSKALGRTAVWETCNIAEEGTRAALAAPKKEEA